MRQFGLRLEDVCVTVSPGLDVKDGKHVPNGKVWFTLFDTPEREMTLELTPEDVSDLVRALIYESERRE